MPDRFHLSAGTVRSRDGLHGLRDLTRLKATSADILAAGGAGHEDADLLEVGVEAALGGHHRVAAAMPERRALSAHVTHLPHGGGSEPSPYPRTGFRASSRPPHPALPD